MPRIDDQIIECAVYMYRDGRSATEGARTGGSGFLAGVRIENRDFVYAVTNRHVVRDGFAVIRLNTVVGTTAIVDASAQPWYMHDTEDVAITRIQLTDEHRIRVIPESVLITEEEIRHNNIGPGNHIFMVGRFINLEGRQQNTPALRFGTIAIMPIEPFRNPLGHDTRGYVVEMHSISGYSGSPVFIHILPFEGRPMAGMLIYGYKGESFGPKLLGIDWGHIPGSGTVENSGMSAVVPVSALRTLLNRDDVAAARRSEEA